MKACQDFRTEVSELVSDREIAVAVVEERPRSAMPPNPQESGDSPCLADVVERTLPDSARRFARDYVDPRVPVRSVRYAAVKRLFDLVFASFALAFCAVPMLLIALLIKLTSSGPVLFRQVRVGRGGRHFWCYKFRSMCADAEARRATLMHLNEADGPVFKIRNDPRVTRVGAVLRKFSLDELPQFFNVIRGDMSVVGPRPPLPSEVDRYGPRERLRLAVRPGLTCLWQCSGRSGIGFERWVEMDLFYIETMSFITDLRIVYRTIPAVLFSRGAH